MIFVLAYPKIEGFKVKTKSRWERDEQERRRSNRDTFVARPFLPLKVSEFLVSKKFFVAAARSFVANQHFDESSGCAHFSVLGGPEGIVGQFMMKATLRSWQVKHNRMPPDLKFLKIIAWHDDFEVLEPKHVWEDDLTKADFRKVMLGSKYHLLSGLSELQLVPERCVYATTEAKKAKWQENVGKFQAFLKKYVTRPKDVDSTTQLTSGERLVALYRNSRVCFGTSTLRPERAENAGLYTPVPSIYSSSGISSISNVAPKTQDGRLASKDIPNDLEGFKTLLASRGEEVMAWINEMKSEGVGVLL